MLPLFFHSATSAGAGGGDEDPHRNPYRLKSAHEADVPGDQNRYEEAQTDQTAHTKRIKRGYPSDPGPFGPCPVCQRSFKSSKALHGHMRCHPDRAWRGMVPPENWAPHAGAVQGAKSGGASASAAEVSGVGGTIEWPFRCRDCGAHFRMKQALGGHRASHKSKKGCYMMAREGLAAALLHGIGNNGGGNNRRDGLGRGSQIVDLNLPPPQEEEEEDNAGKD
ncbi:C2H2-like zinc finger protein [Rhynchospora pubera]|uniref:C2H2-like zinc finger protein n=1 Tax=Rhynchospora pubera TaxID=906938 RepID=A0AAV8EE61_9POAL|nr:C2H2-like zinc finger protein [Rhynchospora pubera]